MTEGRRTEYSPRYNPSEPRRFRGVWGAQGRTDPQRIQEEPIGTVYREQAIGSLYREKLSQGKDLNTRGLEST
jgi:hypothetical protein